MTAGEVVAPCLGIATALVHMTQSLYPAFFLFLFHSDAFSMPFWWPWFSPPLLNTLCTPSTSRVRTHGKIKPSTCFTLSSLQVGPFSLNCVAWRNILPSHTFIHGLISNLQASLRYCCTWRSWPLWSKCTPSPCLLFDPCILRWGKEIRNLTLNLLK